MTTAVLDSNVFVSAVCLPDSLPAELISRWLDGEYHLVVSSEILAELSDVPRRPKILKRYTVTDEDIERFLSLLSRRATTVHIDDQPAIVPGDPNDDHIVACAVAGSADVIVSGDNHLISVGEFQGVRVMKPAEFLAGLRRAALSGRSDDGEA
jgi:putative PIN family toxin of toxin-antitoxin system